MSLLILLSNLLKIYNTLLQNKGTSTDDLEKAAEDQEETQELFSQSQLSTPSLTPRDTANVEGGSSSSYETDYEEDPDVPKGVIPQSQPCYRRGIHYTPLGLRRVYRGKKETHKRILYYSWWRQ